MSSVDLSVQPPVSNATAPIVPSEEAAVDDLECLNDRLADVTISPTQPDDKKKKKKKKKPSKAQKALEQRLGGSEDLAYDSVSNLPHSWRPLLPDVLDRAKINKYLPAITGHIGLPDAPGVTLVEYLNAIGAVPWVVPPDWDEIQATMNRDILNLPRPSPKIVSVDTFGTCLEPASAASASHRHPVKPKARLFSAPTCPLGFTLLGFGGNQDNGDPWCIVITTFFANEVFIGHPKYDSPLVIEPHVSDMPFRIQDIPGVGKGLFATRDIAIGDILIREPPLIVYPKAEGSRLALHFDTLLDLLPPRSAAAFDGLANCKPYKGSLISDRYSKTRTNGWDLGILPLPPFAGYGGVFQIISRANHSCVPNVNFKFFWNDFQGTYRACRRIRAGEQITVAYTDTRNSTEERRADLKRKYFFDCTCERCGPL